MAIRITQAGVALTVGIIIVTGLIIGGFFLVKNNGEQARRDEAIKIAQQNLEEQSNTDGEGATEDPDTNRDEQAPSNNEGDDVPVETPRSGMPADTTAPADTAAPTDQAGELPQTGAADQVLSIGILSLLAFSAVSYYQSRTRALS